MTCFGLHADSQVGRSRTVPTPTRWVSLWLSGATALVCGARGALRDVFADAPLRLDEDRTHDVSESLIVALRRAAAGWGDKDGRVTADLSGSDAGAAPYPVREFRHTGRASDRAVGRTALHFVAAADELRGAKR